jgi:hypothetical protein
MAEEKKPKVWKPSQKKPKTPAPHQERISKLLKGLMEWHLTKVNGDPRTEGFDILLATDAPDGGTMCKYALGDFEEAKARLKSDLETSNAGADMYAYSYRGYWQTPDGIKFDGAIVFLESTEVQPVIIGYEIAADEAGMLDIKGGMHRLGIGDWSLFHRAK